MINKVLEFKFIKLCLHKPELFSIGYTPIDPLANWCYAVIKEYANKYHKYPNFSTFKALAKTKCKEQQYAIIEENFDVDIDTEYAMDKITSYVERQRLISGINKAMLLIEEGKIKEAKVEILKGSDAVYSTTLDYFHDEFKVKEHSSIPTGFNSLDAPLRGGLHKENLGLIIGPKSSGKSATMINLGANAVENGHDVLHISFEDSKEQIYERYKHRFKQGNEVSGNLYIHPYPSGQATTADCGALVNSYQPSLVIVDYLNEMGMENEKSDLSRDLGNRARGLKAISSRSNCAIWTAQQAGKAKKFSDVDVRAEDGFWSYEPSQVADVVLTINQTSDEKSQGIIRYNIDRHRNGIDGVKCKFNIDYAKMLVSEIDSIL